MPKKTNMKTFNILPTQKHIHTELIQKINSKTKPKGALGQLEDIAMQIGLIQNTLSPALINPHIIIFAGDHGITKEGVSAYPQEVTFQMVMNFLNGGAAINVFCKQHNIGLKIVDAGVNYDFPEKLQMQYNKIKKGTGNFLFENAMSTDDASKCVTKGADIVNDLFLNKCNIVGFGEMGIGNTTIASTLMSVICNLPVEQCVGKGTGLDDIGILRKIEVIKKAISYHKNVNTPFDALVAFGGLEIAQMIGAMLQAAENKMIILVDGFISTSAFLIAHKINPHISDYAIFCHQSNEQGHKTLLHYLNATPVLNLDLRLGEGTGIAIAYPIIQSAIAFLNNMSSFENARVSKQILK